jgi:PEGA domain-containing protein
MDPVKARQPTETGLHKDRFPVALCCLVAFSGAMVTSGQARASDVAAAEALFRDGSQLLEAGRVDEACPKFAASQKTDPALGTLFYLAVCHEKQGLTASAWAEFSSATDWAQRSNQPERELFGHKHLAALEAKLSTVVIRASTSGLQLRVDEGLVTGAALGTPLPLDPGEHTIEASAPGYEPWHTRITVAAVRKTVTITVPPLTPISVPADSPPAKVEGSPAPAPAEDESRSATRPSASRALAWTSAGLAGAAIVAGSVFGGLAFGARDTAQSDCPNNRCVPGGLAEIARARTYATVSTVGFGVGIAAAAATAYFWIRSGGETSPRTSATGPVTVVPGVGAHEAGLSLLGRFE